MGSQATSVRERSVWRVCSTDSSRCAAAWAWISFFGVPSSLYRCWLPSGDVMKDLRLARSMGHVPDAVVSGSAHSMVLMAVSRAQGLYNDFLRQGADMFS
eukprot:2318678-Prymnesium_polylepis.1